MSLSELFQVLLGEVNAGLSTTQVVVKELKASGSVQDQMHFLEEAQPFRYLFTPLSCPPSFWLDFCLSLCVSDGKVIHTYVHCQF